MRNSCYRTKKRANLVIIARFLVILCLKTLQIQSIDLRKDRMNTIIVVKLVAAHLTGDFLFQRDGMCADKFSANSFMEEVVSI